MQKKFIGWVLFGLIFISEIIAGYYVWHIKGFVFGDGISRVANAFYVLYIQPPHLAAIGMVWNPLPSFMELPLLLLWPIYKPIASSGLAGVIMTSAFAAASGVIIYRYTVKFGSSHFVGIALALLYCFNPFMFIFGFSGLSESPFNFILLWLIFNYTEWLESEEPSNIVQMAIALGLGFLIRYEIIPIAGCLFLGVVFIVLMIHRANLASEYRKDLRYSFERAEGTAIILLTPIVYACLIWILYNWIITGNPLYFLNSVYSNLGCKDFYAANEVLASMIGNPGKIVSYILLCTKYFLIPAVIIIGYRVIKLKVFQWDFLSLVLLMSSTLALQFYMLGNGTSIGAFRYYSFPFVILCAWLPFEMKKFNSKLFTFLCLISLIVSDIALGYAWFQKQEFKNNKVLFEAADLKFECSPKEIAQRDVAQYINIHIPNAKILMDSYRTYNVILNVNQPSNLIVTCSYEFNQAIRNPRKYKVDYLLVPSETNDFSRQDALNRLYPTLYQQGAFWCTPVKEFSGYYKLFKIVQKVEYPQITTDAGKKLKQ
ncbi:MAG TPA: hypothetical protein DDW65_11160 [Firmicutes bacterium]|nr:hypothetical protein [Bacillota bacterium]